MLRSEVTFDNKEKLDPKKHTPFTFYDHNHEIWFDFSRVEDGFFYFTVLRFESSPCDDEAKAMTKDQHARMMHPETEVEEIFCGNFTVGEYRHTNFFPEEDGYGFYPPMEIMTKVFQLLTLIADAMNAK
ncbi:hypothetical protein [Vibrio phage vB_pir03]|nr:hypothetical protein [Vibrio phage vB_pir03]